MLVLFILEAIHTIEIHWKFSTSAALAAVVIGVLACCLHSQREILFSNTKDDNDDDGDDDDAQARPGAALRVAARLVALRPRGALAGER